jgi:hypothetical protein
MKKRRIALLMVILLASWANLADAITVKKTVKDAVQTVFFQAILPTDKKSSDLVIEDQDDPGVFTHYVKVDIPVLNEYNASSINLQVRATWDAFDFVGSHPDYVQKDFKNKCVYIPYAHSSDFYPEGNPSHFWVFFSGKFTLSVDVYK